MRIEAKEPELSVYTFNIQKGGVGKTTINYNGAFYLAVKKHKRVLLIDLDFSCNLTSRFKKLIKQPIQDINTTKELFKLDGKPEPIKIITGIDLIAGYRDLYDMTEEVKAKRNRSQLLKWFFSNRGELESRYDYILIDTHNDFSIFTENALVLSDKVVAIADVDEDALDKLAEEEEKIEDLKNVLQNPVTGESFVNAVVIKIGNKIQSNTADSHKFKREFERLMGVDQQFYGYFELRVPFAKAKTTGEPLVSIEKKVTKKTDKLFFDRTWALFDKIFETK